MMRNYVLVSSKPWHNQMFEKLQKEYTNCNWTRIEHKEDFSNEKLLNLNPEKIFIPHWSYIIPESVYSAHECIVFHMTDLPFGRGGSPLQNLIVRGMDKTKISALRVVGEIDAGDIYLKKDLSLDGSAQDIFNRSVDVIYDMIVEIIEQNPKPIKQEGEVVQFERRKPEQGNLKELQSLEEVYNYIRMLDADGYPPAFLEVNNLRLEFSKAKLGDSNVTAQVKIIEL